MGWTLASDIGVETAKNNNTISLPHKLATYMKQYAIWTHVITAVLTSGILTNLSKFETHFPCFISLIHILYRQNSFSQAKGAGYCKLNISLSLSLSHTHTHTPLPAQNLYLHFPIRVNDFVLNYISWLFIDFRRISERTSATTVQSATVLLSTGGQGADIRPHLP